VTVRPGELIAGAGGLVLLVSLFTSWYEGGVSGWEAMSVIDVILALAALLGIVLLVAQATLRRPGWPVALGVLTTALGLVATVLLVVRIVDLPDTDGLAGGIWLGLAGVVALTVGAWRAMADERNRNVPEPRVEVRPAPPAGGTPAA
jgi:peptidoglycan/LPS O-acetylase OafA/YrhL